MKIDAVIDIDHVELLTDSGDVIAVNPFDLIEAYLLTKGFREGIGEKIKEHLLEQVVMCEAIEKSAVELIEELEKIIASVEANDPNTSKH